MSENEEKEYYQKKKNKKKQIEETIVENFSNFARVKLVDSGSSTNSKKEKTAKTRSRYILNR